MIPERRIVNFWQDDEAQWVAELECGHRQHMRHTPPWQERPWVLTAEGRTEHLGTTLPCRRCGAFRVRPARKRDAQAWASLRQALWPTESGVELTAQVEAFFGGGDPLLQEVFLAENPEGTLLGFAELSLRSHAEDCTTSPVGFLEGWYVIPSSRRQGVGRALVAAAEEWARDQGCRELGSNTERDNLESTAAHQALGFVDAGVLRNFRKPVIKEET
jgi:aminoglycoside 6'-N-acetyltransferase I